MSNNEVNGKNYLLTKEYVIEKSKSVKKYYF